MELVCEMVCRFSGLSSQFFVIAAVENPPFVVKFLADPCICCDGTVTLVGSLDDCSSAFRCNFCSWCVATVVSVDMVYAGAAGFGGCVVVVFDLTLPTFHLWSAVLVAVGVFDVVASSWYYHCDFRSCLVVDL